MKNIAQFIKRPQLCRGKSCLGERTDRIAALYARMVEAAKFKSSYRNRRKSSRSPIGIETGSICLSVQGQV